MRYAATPGSKPPRRIKTVDFFTGFHCLEMKHIGSGAFLQSAVFQSGSGEKDRWLMKPEKPDPA
jgi:hypothetical protein